MISEFCRKPFFWLHYVCPLNIIKIEPIYLCILYFSISPVEFFFLSRTNESWTNASVKIFKVFSADLSFRMCLKMLRGFFYVNFRKYFQEFLKTLFRKFYKKISKEVTGILPDFELSHGSVNVALAVFTHFL